MSSTTINLAPLSVNKAWQGRRFRTKEYKDWTETGLWLLKKHKKYTGIVGVDIIFYMKNYKLADIDNPLKAFFDLIVKAGLIEDDRYIEEMTVRKEKSKVNQISFEIYKI